jgi:hypothetical protein
MESEVIWRKCLKAVKIVATQGLRSGEVIDVVLYCWELPNFR